MTGSSIRWHVHDRDADVLAAALAALTAHAADALSARGRFTIVLSGGATPRPLYTAAAALETDWDRWEFFFGDERCVPVGDSERNDRLAREAWLDRVPVRPEQIHSIPAELGPDEGAARYRAVLADVGPFDLVVLGCGSDGHTASLFPGRPLGSEPDAPDALGVRDAPKPPPERVTLSAARLKRTRGALLLVLGEGKRDALAAVRAGADLPVRAVVGPSGLDVYADRAAAGR